MPSIPQFSRPGLVRISLGLIRTTITAAFARAFWYSTALSSCSGGRLAGIALTSWPTTMSDGLIGRAVQAHRAEQRAADQFAPAEAGLGRTLLERLGDVGDLLRRGVGVVPLLGDLLVDHQLLGPLDRAGADQEQRHAQAQADDHVVGVAGQRAELEDGVTR